MRVLYTRTLVDAYASPHLRQVQSDRSDLCEGDDIIEIARYIRRLVEPRDVFIS